MADLNRSKPALLALALVVLAAYAALAFGGGGAPALHTESPQGARYRLDDAAAERAGARVLTRAQRDATFRFDPAIPEQDRQTFLAAIGAARPEARRLLDVVDGLVDVLVGTTAVPAAGSTEELPDRYEVIVDFAQIWQALGQRGVNRLVLHEMAHVIDMAVLPDDVTAGLVAGVPAGWGCEQGVSGSCAVPEERFAESFAKWAVGDIGVDLNIGYRVPPPSRPLDAWGGPLAGLPTGP